MFQIKEQFAESGKALKKVKTIVMTALLIALGIILGQFSIQVTIQSLIFWVVIVALKKAKIFQIIE